MAEDPGPRTPADPTAASVGRPGGAGGRVFEVDLLLSREQMLHYYRGTVDTVVARLRDGRTISLPIASLRPFLTHHGIRGTFRVAVDRNNRLVDLARVPGR